MLRRELALALRARLAWMVAALSALLVGHGFVLAVDLYAAGSRSVRANVLMAREFDPLAGIVRPTLGGLYLAASLLVPLLAARPLAVEKERRSLGPLLLMTGSPGRVVAAKFAAAMASSSLLLVGPAVALAAWRLAGGHLSPAETAVALGGHALYLVALCALGTAAAAWLGTLAQAAALGVVVVLSSWAIDAADGFAALAWLGGAAPWSFTTHLTPFERGTLMPADALWMLAATALFLALAWVGLGLDASPRRKATAAALLVVAGVGVLHLTGRWRRGLDLTEAARASLPPAAVRALRDLRGPIALDVWLDRDDSRRRQMESDVLAKLRLARPDAAIRFPLDARSDPAEAAGEEGYGRTVVRVAERRGETYSASRREIVTVIFETAGAPLPSWWQPTYPGFPMVPSGRARRWMALAAYGLAPGGLLGAGLWITRRRRRS
jgi:hypothetical protein